MIYYDSFCGCVLSRFSHHSSLAACYNVQSILWLRLDISVITDSVAESCHVSHHASIFLSPVSACFLAFFRSLYQWVASIASTPMTIIVTIKARCDECFISIGPIDADSLAKSASESEKVPTGSKFAK